MDEETLINHPEVEDIEGVGEGLDSDIGELSLDKNETDVDETDFDAEHEDED